LKFIDEKEPVINEIKRISKPGGRVYVNSDKIKQVKNGLGIAVLSTSKGLVTDKTARELGIGGEVLCTVW
jgi:small subunit ribosomal protein S8